MSLSEEQRRKMIRDAGSPKKRHHWTIGFDYTNGFAPKIYEWKTQFGSADGSLVSHRISRERYTVIDRETSYVVANVPGRTYAKGCIDELGPDWARLSKLLFIGDSDAVNRVKEVLRKHKSVVG